MTVASIIDDALACVALEHGEAYDLMRRALAGRRLELVVGSERVAITLDPTVAPTIRARLSIDALCALLLGEVTVLDAVVAERVEVFGSVEDLTATGEAVSWFLQGALRCVSLAPIAERLLALREGGN